MFGTNKTILSISFVGCLGACGILYGWFIPQLITAGNADRAVTYVLIGWIPFTLACYLLGRLTTSPDGLPSMRPATSGAVIVVLSLLVSIGIDSWGVDPVTVPEAHLVQALGVFVGLALLGWGVGKRSEAIVNLNKKQTT